MKQMPLVIAHYTLNTGYEKEVKKLIASLHRWDLEYEVTPIETRGSWRANSNYCSQHILDMLKKHQGRDVLRVDADAVFQQFPSLFLEDVFTCDVAAHVHDFRWHQNELLGGTLFFRNTPEVLRLVEDWRNLSMKVYPDRRNPDLLQQLIQGNGVSIPGGPYEIEFGVLPPEYCRIFDLMADVPNPVIEHFQASRRFRREVNVQAAHMRQKGKRF